MQCSGVASWFSSALRLRAVQCSLLHSEENRSSGAHSAPGAGELLLIPGRYSTWSMARHDVHFSMSACLRTAGTVIAHLLRQSYSIAAACNRTAKVRCVANQVELLGMCPIYCDVPRVLLSANLLQGTTTTHGQKPSGRADIHLPNDAPCRRSIGFGIGCSAIVSSDVVPRSGAMRSSTSISEHRRPRYISAVIPAALCARAGGATAFTATLLLCTTRSWTDRS
jgi:hypothetical protein